MGRALLLRICAVAVLLAAAALSSAAWAHGLREHGVQHATIAGALLHEGAPEQAFAAPGEGNGTVLDRMPAVPHIPCSGACCCANYYGGCLTALADDVLEAVPVVSAGTRVPHPTDVGGPGTVPEALPKPPKSFA